MKNASRKAENQGFAPASGVVFDALARGLEPPLRRTVAQWAADRRIVSPESGSPAPGKWSNSLAPYLVEPMECVTPSHPARSVVFQKCHQAGYSEVGLNLIGHIIEDDPAPVLIVLPTTGEVKKYVKTKLQPMIEATPSIASRVREQKSRDEEGSTTTFKKFTGGFLQITGANSSAGLQMISVRVVIREEVSEYPADVDGRGDPAELAANRATAWEGYEKIVDISTPGLKGSCRISARFELSDQRALYCPCPQCGAFQQLKWERLDKDALDPTYGCVAHGCVIDHRSLKRMLREAVWLKCYPGTDANPAPPAAIEPAELAHWRKRGSDGRDPGFKFTALTSPFMSWAKIAKKWRDAHGVDAKEKEFCQQVLAEPWEEKGDSPDHQRLFEKRVVYEWRRIPKGALFLTGAADVQGDRIEWAVYAWGPEFCSWLIDKGVIEGDPTVDATWEPLDDVLEHTWPDENGKPWKLDGFAIDTGFLSHDVYRWVRGHAHTGKVFAVDGRKGWQLPALGTPKKTDIDFKGKKIGQVLLWPVGNWGLKSELYSALKKMIRGRNEISGEFVPGVALYGDACDLAYLEQLTAEQLVTRVGRNGLPERVWEIMSGRRNEAHDIAVYARAIAHHFGDGLRPEEWAALAVRRAGAPQPPAPVQQQPRQQEQWGGAEDDRGGDDWLGGRTRNWLRN